MEFSDGITPDKALDNAFAQMADLTRMDEFSRQYKLNISSPTDDSPFIFLMSRITAASILKGLMSFELGAENILFMLLAVMLVLTVTLIIVPLTGQKGEEGFVLRDFKPFLFYFSLIGLAFMLVEISQMTRLSMFLGHPIYSLAVVLFALLISSGVGSFVLGKVTDPRHLRRVLLAFILVCLLFAVITPLLLAYFMKYNIIMRLLVSVAMISPLGFFMGAFLPQGVRLLEKRGGPVALFWGLNGAMSVIGSIVAMILLIQVGIKFTFWIGIALYVMAIKVMFSMLSPAQEV